MRRWVEDSIQESDGTVTNKIIDIWLKCGKLEQSYRPCWMSRVFSSWIILHAEKVPVPSGIYLILARTMSCVPSTNWYILHFCNPAYQSITREEESERVYKTFIHSLKNLQLLFCARLHVDHNGFISCVWLNHRFLWKYH